MKSQYKIKRVKGVWYLKIINKYISIYSTDLSKLLARVEGLKGGDKYEILQNN
jgi:hypothetical protein